MEMRKMGIWPAAIVLAVCLTGLACTAKRRYYVPEIYDVQPPEAKVGTSVVISGVHFKDAWNISFGGIPALTYTINSDTQITATVPTNAITYPIEINNPAGVGDSLQSFIVMPVVSSCTVVSETGITPIVVTLAGSGFYDTSSVTIGGVSCPFTYNDPNTLTVDVAADIPSGQVVVTASGIASTDDVIYTPPVPPV
jgi:hypothetical protein